MNNFTQRAITGLVLVLVITISVMGSPYSFMGLLMVINILSLLEFYRLFQSGDISPRRTAGILLSAAMLLTCYLAVSAAGHPKIILINVPLVFGVFILELFRNGKKPFSDLAFTFLALLCITVPLCFFIAIAFFPGRMGIYHPGLVLGYFCILWASDTGAYFIGKTFGKHHLFERISPKKTWEGSIGGTVGALFTSWVIARYFSILSLTLWINMAFIIVVAGTFGDLIKSLMKRTLNLKDSGTILPGHGGMLDRFDSLLGSAPLVYCYLNVYGVIKE